MTPSCKRILTLLAALFSMCLSLTPASAKVQIAFHSRELGGNNFPHAFVTLKGQPDRGGPPIDVNYGFTAKAVTPAILMGSVGGTVMTEPAQIVARSTPHFVIDLTDEQLIEVLNVVRRWQARPQPSYNLNKANCVYFAGELAQAAGLKVAFRKELMKKPKSFMVALKNDNADFLSTQSSKAELRTTLK